MSTWESSATPSEAGGLLQVHVRNESPKFPHRIFSNVEGGRLIQCAIEAEGVDVGSYLYGGPSQKSLQSQMEYGRPNKP